MRRWLSLGLAPPGRDSTQLEQLRFVRNLQLRSLTFAPVIVALFVVFDLPPLAWVVLAAACLVQVLSAWRLTQRMRRSQESS